VSIKLDYNAAKKEAVFTLTNGRPIRVQNVTEAKARQMLERDMPEFERRDGCLTSVGGHFTRGDANGR
jgi:hypothetical protein